MGVHLVKVWSRPLQPFHIQRVPLTPHITDAIPFHACGLQTLAEATYMVLDAALVVELSNAVQDADELPIRYYSASGLGERYQ
jgi:hypothetical protein